jgi:hypothetical protein
MKSVRRLSSATSLFLSLCAPLTGYTQNIGVESGAQSLLIDPSVRSSGMGRSSNAVFWGYSPNSWGNPALLGFHKGVQYERGRTRLVPELADDVSFTTKRLTVGFWGLGILIAGRPFTDVGGMELNYGASFATDVDGNIIGVFTSYETIQSFAGGANILEFAEHALAAGGLDPPLLSRFGDVAIGWSEKKTHVFLAPADVTLDGIAGEGYVTTHDSGLLVRLTPYNSIDYAGFFPGLDRIAGTRVDLSYGGSTQNYNDGTIAYIDPDQADPIARIQRKGWAAHLALDLPAKTRDRLKSRRFGWLLDCITPILSVGKTGQKDVPMVLDTATDAHRTGTRVENSGWELTLANIYSIRGGRIDDPAGTVQGHTSGWGVGLHVRDLLGFSYDRADVPQSVYLGRVKRKSLTFYFDPVRAWELLRPGRGS